MTPTIEELAEAIASLEPSKQEELLNRVAALNFRKGLEQLSKRYRNRLAAEDTLKQKAAEVLSNLKEVREQIASDEYSMVSGD
ncbi:MAG: hypothetical protein ACRDIB_06180 [Ardenticatenaceae bacterium]